MKVYQPKASSLVRLLYGIELVEGLRAFPETEGLAPGLEAQNKTLDDRYTCRLALYRSLARARARRRIGEFRMDALLRQLGQAIEAADGGRKGPLYEALLPTGPGGLVAPVGQRQAEVVRELLTRIARCQAPGIEALTREWVPRLKPALEQFEKHNAELAAAQQAFNEAVQDELAERDEHLRTVMQIKGQVLTALAGDRIRQDAVFPEAEIAAGRIERGDELGGID